MSLYTQEHERLFSRVEAKKLVVLVWCPGLDGVE